MWRKKGRDVFLFLGAPMRRQENSAKLTGIDVEKNRKIVKSVVPTPTEKMT